MSTKQRKQQRGIDGRRPYRKRRRAEQEDETHRRITEAAVDLHGSVGPAKTTISAVAERAGVQRATVYRHFPDEEALFAACSSHWISENPLPDLDGWADIEDPDLRLRTGLAEVYEWFERGEYMLEKTTRDVSVVPSLQPAMTATAMWFQAATQALARGRRLRGRRHRRVLAAIGHAISFATWRSLVREQELTTTEAVTLMADMVGTAQRR